MKSPYILPAATALVGFAVAWVAKPSSPENQTGGASLVEQSKTVTNPRVSSSGRTSAAEGTRPKEVNASDFPLADQMELGPKTKDEGRMLRLTEALGLTVEQQGSIISLIETAQANIDPGLSVIDDLAVRGKIIQDGLAELLSAEQMAKFEEVRVRERENRVEARAQSMLTPTVEEIDMSPEQREEVLSRLRLKARTDMQSIPAAATLLLDKSLLPTNNKELSVDGLLTAVQMDQPMDISDPEGTHKKVVDRHRQALEELLLCFDGVLTPGQMSQLQAGLNEQKELMNKMARQQRERAVEMVPDEPEPPASEGAVSDESAR